MARKATSQDVANRAGVSRSAVSFVLNGRADGNIAKDKQLRILAAAKELNYTPNAVARSLQAQRTHTIGVVTDTIAGGPFAGELLQGASSAAFDAGYLLLVIETQNQEARENSAFTMLLDRQVDALVFAAESMRPHTPHPAMHGVPAVLANCFDPEGGLRSVMADEVAGGRSATQILLDSRHINIAYLSGPLDAVAAQRRTEGFDTAIAASGRPPIKAVETGWDINDGYAAAMRLFSDDGGHSPKHDRPTGVVCANDRVALGVMLACARLGLRVPEDLSIVGYDNHDPLAKTTVPGLTTVAIPHREMGEKAVEILLGELSNGIRKESSGTVLIPCPVVMRGSVAAPPLR
ncbi:LacI family transcriptional regulator [Arthrobacter stackebrandtii]|uniref:LacI family transcriptional regulator n=1 Tax=Arthrobacter stackebrandtii TaxID=272161 RepID=A0ABS4YUQ3_9MICC|nr:LacI family DNA-binding transcriptional regulator [Arthrobacter stackebrandtii]MBP2412506.1 LacI family transcriptional regulator [Arthrobacter stackebrandtii]PYH02258.1 LacI family transcriptional regulator [Arthrobacter stackebrandtii]